MAQDFQFDVAEQAIVETDPLQIEGDVGPDAGIGEAFGNTVAVAPVGDLVSDIGKVLLELLESHFEPGYIRRSLGTVIHNPDVVKAGREKQCIDVVRKLATIVGEHGQHRKLGAVGSAQVRRHIGFRGESSSTDVHVSRVLNLKGGNGNFRIGLGK
jgi:hypothetical protein